MLAKMTRTISIAQAARRAEAHTNSVRYWASKGLIRLVPTPLGRVVDIGVSYMFSANDPYVGADFDDCLDPETGELDPLALERIRALDSYTDLSPSGRSAKVIVRACLPPKGRKRGKVEMYETVRQFTITGNTLPGAPATINARQEAAAV